MPRGRFHRDRIVFRNWHAQNVFEREHKRQFHVNRASGGVKEHRLIRVQDVVGIEKGIWNDIGVKRSPRS